jgi:thioredoxin-dependent peroxiredoxin
MLKLMSVYCAGVGLAAMAAAVSGQAPAGPVSPEPVQLKVGDMAPPFALQGSDGKVHKLSDYKGKTVVLAWFPKAFTGGWTAECNSLRASGDLIRGYDVAWFMASVDKPEDNKAFAEKEQANFPILSDPDKTAANAYGVIPAGRTPDRQMASRWTFYIGPDGKILAIEKTVKPASAGEEIVAKLAELGVRKRQ